MALYVYQALAKDGKKIKGTLDAPSSIAVKEQLVRQGLFPIAIELAKDQLKQGWWQRLTSRSITPKDRILFTRQLSVLLKSGIPLLESLELLVEQFDGALRSMLIAIKDEIKQGTSLADALSNYPRVFDTTYVQLVRAGEASGKLEVILDRLTSFLERRAAIEKKIAAATQYPLMQLGVAVLVVGVMMVFVVPKMAENFQGKMELPGPTQFLMAVSNFMTDHYLILLGGLLLIAFGFNYWRKTPSGSRAIDELILKIPLIKYFAKTSAVVQFSYTLGMLIEGGVNLAESLDIVTKIIDNRVLADALNQARDKIIKQGKIAQYLKQTGIFPPMAIHLINTGEQSGQLDAMLLTVARNYEEDLGELTDSLTAKLGPILLICMAIIVGFIVIAIALPITQMSELAGKF